MEALLALFACVLLLVVVAGPVLAIVALVRASRIGALEQEVGKLRRQVERLDRPADDRPAAPERPAATAEALEHVAAYKARAPEPEAPVETTDVGPPPLPPPPKPMPKPKEPSKLRQIEWERWIGVRGAAVLGGMILALAAILFFQHAITEGWITPAMRVALGTVTGFGLLAAGHVFRKRGIDWVPSALEGAGIVALYATIWAADERYEMLSLAASFPLMVVVTALACLLAVRHRSLVSAMIGLAGGFATPLLLASDSDRPFRLFGYILLLDLGLIFVGQKRRWPSIGALALVGTFLLESVWIFGEMGPGRLWLGLVILAVFAVLFAVSGGLVQSGERRKWLPAQAGAVLFPFVFALYFAGHVDFRGHVYPTALLLGLLTIAALVVARTQGVPWLPISAAASCVAAVSVWVITSGLSETAQAWELVAVAVGLALIPHVGGEWERRRDRSMARPRTWFGQAAAGSAGAWMLLAVLSCNIASTAPLWPFLLLLVALAALLVRQAWVTGLELLLHGSAFGLGLGLSVYRSAHSDGIRSLLPDERIYVVLLVLLALAFLLGGLRVAGARGRALLHAAGIFVVLQVIDLANTTQYHAHDPWLEPTAILAFGIVLAVVATALRWSLWYGVAALSSCMLVWRWGLEFESRPGTENEFLVGLLFVLVIAAFATAWPVAFRARFAERNVAWRIAGLVPVLLLIPVGFLYELRFGADLRLAPPLLLGLLQAGALAPLAPRGGTEAMNGARRVALAWYGTSCLFLFALTVPLQIDVNEAAIAGALWAVGLAWLARRLAHPGLAWLASAVTAFAMLLLLRYAFANHHYAVADLPVANWIGYTNLVPAAAAAAVVILLRPVPDFAIVAPRLRLARRIVPGICTLGAMFTWLNLEIMNHFATGARISLDPERLPARDVTISIAWGVFALVLLVVGTARKTSALRWSSLALFFLAIGKVFLYDLGRLEGLYRVASLAGLAMSLIAVSLLYQRFVFRK